MTSKEGHALDRAQRPVAQAETGMLAVHLSSQELSIIPAHVVIDEAHQPATSEVLRKVRE